MTDAVAGTKTTAAGATDVGTDPALARLMERFAAREPAALARAISIVENHRDGHVALTTALHRQVGRARRIGITGPPGAGKSTLTNALTRLLRHHGHRVAIVAVDPTSPFTGGALLGDRIRMEDIALDPGVYIRSMATRGSLGGLANTTGEVCDVLDAFGFDFILIETVGVGQSELDIAKAADSTVVVLVPESGDSVQTLKAGVMEIADIYVVNKADRPGGARLRTDVAMMLGLRETRESDWTPPVLLAQAATGEGINAVQEALDGHARHLAESGALSRRRRTRTRDRVRSIVEEELRDRLWGDPETGAWLDAQLLEIERGGRTPIDVARALRQRSAALMTSDARATAPT